MYRSRLADEQLDMQRGLIGTVVRLLGNRSYIAIGLVTLLTLGVVGAVVLTTTSVGCSPSSWLGVKATRCTTQPVAKLGISNSPTASAAPQESPSPVNPSAPPVPPNNPGNSGVPPVIGPTSSGYPPMAYPGSGSGIPGVTLSCRLPVYTGGPGSGGFIVFPGSTFVADPRSAVTPPSDPGMTYDATYSKWLPVRTSWVSPDGSHYAYPLNGNVYVESVVGGAQIVLGAGKHYYVIAVENDGVYVTVIAAQGLWFLPFSGAERQVSATGYWQAESHGAAYGTATWPGSVATDTILKLDASTGTASDFFTQQGGQSYVTGFDGQGHPVIRVTYPGGAGLYIATAANESTYIAATFSGGSGVFPQGAPVADSQGLWFSAGNRPPGAAEVVRNGIVLYTQNAWYWMSNVGGQLAGACL